MSSIQTISAKAARRLFLAAQGLLDDPARAATPAAVRRLVSSLGFVQLDSINAVARAHDLVLASRLDGYTPAALVRLLERERFLFEGWTHDASAIPTAWYPHWKARFSRDRPRIEQQSWWRRLLGADAVNVARGVLSRIEKEGPLRANDFERTQRSGGFWAWTPEKAALDYLWRTGELAIHGRVHFQKVYDLTERVLPAHHAKAVSEPEAHQEWACATAAERLIVFSATELAQFWRAIDISAARSWCASAERNGRVVPVLVEGADGSAPRPAFALADWESRLAALPSAPRRMRVLAPFDPVLRDRARCLRRFAFDYTFEAFTPSAKRTYGYYVLPLLEGERLVGRIDPKLDRKHQRLEVPRVWWEPGVVATRARKRALDDAIGRLAAFVGAREVEGP